MNIDLDKEGEIALKKGKMEHIPVLKSDVEKLLDVKNGEVVVDTTLGLGGHALDILKGIGKSGRLIAFDQDERNLRAAREHLKEYENQIVYINDNFRYLKSRITEEGITEVDAVLFDLGLSSPHLDEDERGFSFMREGPLDMRFNQSQKLTAGKIVNEYEFAELARIFREYGEEKFAGKIAGAICDYRKTEPLKTTLELAGLIEKAKPRKRSSKKAVSHPATQVFQALRIEVNDELNALKDALGDAVEVLRIGGRIVIISYHSLEDRIVKHFFRDLMQPKAEGKESIYSIHADPYFESLTKKPVIPDEKEIVKNPRSRSAKLRVYKKIKDLKA